MARRALGNDPFRQSAVGRIPAAVADPLKLGVHIRDPEARPVSPRRRLLRPLLR